MLGGVALAGDGDDGDAGTRETLNTTQAFCVWTTPRKLPQFLCVVFFSAPTAGMPIQNLALNAVKWQVGQSQEAEK